MTFFDSLNVHGLEYLLVLAGELRVAIDYGGRGRDFHAGLGLRFMLELPSLGEQLPLIALLLFHYGGFYYLQVPGPLKLTSLTVPHPVGQTVH